MVKSRKLIIAALALLVGEAGVVIGLLHGAITGSELIGFNKWIIPLLAGGFFGSNLVERGLEKMNDDKKP